MRAPSRTLLADLALFVGAWLVRFGWMGRFGALHATVDPTELRSVRQAFDGHERLLFEAFLGQPPTPSPQAWPLSIWMHQALGWFTTDPRALLLLASVAGALSAVFVSVAVRRKQTLEAGLAAGVLVALLPEHVAWSTSAIPVVHGLACLTAAVAVRSPMPRAVLCALAAAFRPELAVPALFLGPPGLAAGAIAAAQLAWVGTPPAADLWPVLRVNLPLVWFIGPPVLVVALLALRDRTTALLAGLAVTTHLVGASFSDYGARHALPAAMALCALAALDPRKRWLPVVVGLGLLPALVDLQARWHIRADPPVFHTPPHPSADCIEVTDEPPVPGQPMPSWVVLASGDHTAPCVLWGEAPEHSEWSSRGLRDRAIRMRHTWRLVPHTLDARGPGRPWLLRWRLTDGPGLRGTMVVTSEPARP